jgi:ribonucleoside-diphosphate reductase alpha chain
MTEMFEYVNQRMDNKPLIAEEVHKVIQENAEFLDSHIIYNRDFNYDYFGFKH